MKDKTSLLSERRRELLAQISQVPVIIDGTLSQRERKRGGMRAMVYCQLQRWRRGRNDTRHVPSERVDTVRKGIEGYKCVQALITEIAQLDERAVLGTLDGDSKKKSTKP
jgi:hypothetical protein